MYSITSWPSHYIHIYIYVCTRALIECTHLSHIAPVDLYPHIRREHAACSPTASSAREVSTSRAASNRTIHGEPWAQADVLGPHTVNCPCRSAGRLGLETMPTASPHSAVRVVTPRPYPPAHKELVLVSKPYSPRYAPKSPPSPAPLTCGRPPWRPRDDMALHCVGT